MVASRPARLCVLFLSCLALANANEQAHSESLVQAVNAALVRIIQSGQWNNIVSKWNKPFAASWTCNPDPEKYLFPDYLSLDNRHVLKQVLDTRLLKMGSFLDANWGSDGIYDDGAPYGFWPEIENAITHHISEAYSTNLGGLPLELDRVWFTTSNAMLNALRLGRQAAPDQQIHLTGPFMFVSSLYTDPENMQNYFRHERFQMSCAVGSATHTGFTSSSTSVDTQQALNNYISSQSSPVPIGVLTSGNWGQYRPILDSNALGVYVSDFVIAKTDGQTMLDNLDSKLEAVRDFQVGNTEILMNWTLSAVKSGDTTVPVTTKTDVTTFLDGLAPSASFTAEFDHFSDTDHLVEGVVRGDVYAGVVSALPSLSMDSRLHTFDMSALSPQAPLFRKDEIEDTCEDYVQTGCAEGALHLQGNPLSSSLGRAVDAAIVRMIASGEWENIVRSNSKWLAASWTCSPSPDSYPFPGMDSLTDADVLKQVLDRGELRVGGFYSNWGSDGNYQAEPATGFYPELMDAIVNQIRTAYGKDAITLQLKRIWLNASPLILQALNGGTSYSPEDQQIDMTEPYMLVSSFYKDPMDEREYFRHERFLTSCTIGSAENAAFVRHDSGISSQISMNAWIEERGMAGNTTLVGTLTKGNYDSYRPVISSYAEGSYLSEVSVASAEEMTTLLSNVDSQTLEAPAEFMFNGVRIIQGATISSYMVGDDSFTDTNGLSTATINYAAGVKVVFDHFVDTDHLIEAVVRGDVHVGIVAATQAVFTHVELTAFKLSLLSPQSAMFRMDGPMDICPAEGLVPAAKANDCPTTSTSVTSSSTSSMHSTTAEPATTSTTEEVVGGAHTVSIGGQLLALSAALTGATMVQVQ